MRAMLPEAVRTAILSSADALWTYLLPVLLLATGLFLTVRFGFVQVRHFAEGLRTLIPRAEQGARGALSPFQAFMTALARHDRDRQHRGRGDRGGLAAARARSSGSGATASSPWPSSSRRRCSASRYRVVDGERALGRAHALPARRPEDCRRLGWVYALVAGVAALTTTPFTQPNSIAVVLESEFGIRTWVTGRRASRC